MIVSKKKYVFLPDVCRPDGGLLQRMPSICCVLVFWLVFCDLSVLIRNAPRYREREKGDEGISTSLRFGYPECVQIRGDCL